MTDTTTDTTTSTTEAPAPDATGAGAGKQLVGDAPDQATTTIDEGADETSLLGSAGSEKKEDGEGGKGEGGEPEGESGPPEAYEIALKDEDGNDLPLDPAMLGEATELFRELGLSNEAANKLAPLGPKLMNMGVEAALAQSAQEHGALKKSWAEAAKADERIGGGKMDESMHLAAKALDALGFGEGHEFRTLLDVSGFGNHPDMIFAFSKLGSLVAEDNTFARSDAVSETKVVGWADRYKD